MGVRGLASFCTAIEPQISEKFELTASPDQPHDADDAAGTAFVIDALAFLFTTFHSHFGDSLYGGEYAAFSQHILDCVHAWRAVGLRPIFVFDGKGPESKLDTISSRITAKAAHLALYMRSPAESRTSIRWQVSCNFLPPLQIDALLDTLHRARVQTVMALEEADAIVASLAGSLGGYSVSRDSDMFVLNPPGTAYKGYVPIESIAYVWKDLSPSQDSSSEQSRAAADAEPVAAAPEEDDGFTAVVTSRKGRKGRTAPQPAANPVPAFQPSQSSVPTSSSTNVQPHPPPSTPSQSTAARPQLHSITFTAYKPSKLAEYLELPVTLLPILGSLLGNDHSHAAHFQVLFEQSRSSGLNAGQRVGLCAQLLRDEVARAASPASATTTTPKRGKSALSSMTSSRTPSAPGSPNPWRKSTQRLGSGKGTSPASPKTPPTPSVSGTGSSGLESSFVSIRSIGSVITSTGLATPRLGATTGGEWASGPGGDEDDDGASLLSDMPTDPVRNLIEAVVRRIVLGPPASSASSSASGTALPMGRDRRAGSTTHAPGEGTPQWEAVIDAILEGVRSYALLVQQAPDDIANPDTSRFTSHLDLSSRSGGLDDEVEVLLLDAHNDDDDPTRAARLEVMQKYARAFKETYFFDGLATMMTFRFYIPRLSLEDPDQTAISVNAPRQIRRWVYAILFGAFGFHWARESVESEQGKEGSEESEEEDPNPSSGARPVRGGMTSSWIIPNAKDVDGDPDELVLVQTPPSVSSYDEGSLLANSDEDDESVQSDAHRPQEPKRQAVGEDEKEKAAPVVLEMVRKGDRCAEDEVMIPSIPFLFDWWKKRFAPIPAELQPFATCSEIVMEGTRPKLPNVQLALAPAAVRQQAYLYVLYSDNALTRALEPALQPLAACLRFLMKSETERWGFSAPRRIWRREELEAAIYAGCVGLLLWQARWDKKSHEGESSSSSAAVAAAERNAWAYPSATATTARTNPPPTARAIHLSTSLQATLDAAHVLSQVLLLYPSPYSPPYALHEGPLFHAHLSTSLLAQNGSSPSSSSSSSLPPLWKDADLERKTKAVLDAVLEGVTLIGRDVDQERREKKKQLRTVHAGEEHDKKLKQQQQQPKQKESSSSSGRKKSGGSAGAPSNLYAMLQIE